MLPVTAESDESVEWLTYQLVLPESELPRPIPRNSNNQTLDVHRGSTLKKRVIT